MNINSNLKNTIIVGRNNLDILNSIAKNFDLTYITNLAESVDFVRNRINSYAEHGIRFYQTTDKPQFFVLDEIDSFDKNEIELIQKILYGSHYSGIYLILTTDNITSECLNKEIPNKFRNIMCKYMMNTIILNKIQTEDQYIKTYLDIKEEIKDKIVLCEFQKPLVYLG